MKVERFQRVDVYEVEDEGKQYGVTVTHEFNTDFTDYVVTDEEGTVVSDTEVQERILHAIEELEHPKAVSYCNWEECRIMNSNVCCKSCEIFSTCSEVCHHTKEEGVCAHENIKEG